MSTKMGCFVLKPWKTATISRTQQGTILILPFKSFHPTNVKGHIYCVLALKIKGSTYYVATAIISLEII